jgi:hypothetical protein
MPQMSGAVDQEKDKYHAALMEIVTYPQQGINEHPVTQGQARGNLAHRSKHGSPNSSSSALVARGKADAAKRSNPSCGDGREPEVARSLLTELQDLLGCSVDQIFILYNYNRA